MQTILFFGEKFSFKQIFLLVRTFHSSKISPKKRKKIDLKFSPTEKIVYSKFFTKRKNCLNKKKEKKCLIQTFKPKEKNYVNQKFSIKEKNCLDKKFSHKEKHCLNEKFSLREKNCLNFDSNNFFSPKEKHCLNEKFTPK